jgi:hypothetical protein
VTTAEPGDEGKTAPVELPRSEASSPPAAPPAEPEPELLPASGPPIADGTVHAAGPLEAARPDVMYVPLAVTIGDGFKFGCGFFMALVLAMLVGFVVLAALFALTTVIGLNLPLNR